MKITTNNKPRNLISWHELPEKIKEDFDYIKEDDRYSNRLFYYKGCYYDAYDMMRCPDPVPADGPNHFAGWHAYVSDSYFSGAVIRFVGHDRVTAGWYCC